MKTISNFENISYEEINNFQKEQLEKLTKKAKIEKTSSVVKEKYADELSDKVAKLASEVESQNVDLRVSIAKDQKKIDTKNEFVLLFTKNLNDIINFYDLNKTDIKLLLLILEKMSKGNQVNITQTALAKELNIDRSNLNRNFKKLRECKILIKDEYNNEFINYNLCINVRTDTILKDQKLYERLEISDENTNDILTKSFKN